MYYHKNLEKQVQKTLSSEHLNDPAIRGLLKLVSISYSNFDRNKELCDHSWSVCEKEYQQVLHNLRFQIEAKEHAERGASIKSIMGMAHPLVKDNALPAQTENTAVSFDLTGITILLVEDIAFNVLVAEKMLTKRNAIVEVAVNGVIAVSKARQQHFDIILMDLQMPVMDGFSATRHIREFNADIPIIALTASAAPDVPKKITEFGMNDYLAKPFKPSDLFEIIQKHSGR